MRTVMLSFLPSPSSPNNPSQHNNPPRLVPENPHPLDNILKSDECRHAQKCSFQKRKCTSRDLAALAAFWISRATKIVSTDRREQGEYEEAGLWGSLTCRGRTAEVHADRRLHASLQAVHVRPVEDAVAHGLEYALEVGTAEVGAGLELR